MVFDLSQAPDYSYFTLSNPDRLVVDLKKSTNGVKLEKVENNSPLVKRVRLSQPPEKGTLRVVIDLKRAAKANLFSLPPTAPYGNRLVVDLDDKSTSAKQGNPDSH